MENTAELKTVVREKKIRQISGDQTETVTI